MRDWLKNEWNYFYDTFHGSETIIWARAQYLLFAIYTSLQAVDVSLFFSDKKLLQGYILINAFIGEMARRHREDWDQK